MEKLNKSLVKDFDIELKEKVLQFGEGNFLRAFVDFLIEELNENNLFGGSVTVVQPINQGLIGMMKEQDYLYTLIERGLQNGEIVNKKRIVKSIKKGINPYEDFASYQESIKNSDLRFIVSNTTEAGITYSKEDMITDAVQNTFPAKVTALLHERFTAFNGDMTKGFIFIPCELIDNNGTNLHKIVLQYADDWNLGEDFKAWVNNANYFTNTLVDRIVTGYPREEIEDLTNELGYVDNLVDTCEIFYLFVVEAPQEIRHELPFEKLNLNVIWTDDATNYKLRKVRILNGGHTMSICAAYLTGKDTVLEMVSDENLKEFLKGGIFEEIIPTINLPKEELTQFADDVLERFANPYIKHNLLSISLNSISKFKVRVLPSLLEYLNIKNALPKRLTFSFASLLAFYKGCKYENGVLTGIRNGAEYPISDDKEILEYFFENWKKVDVDSADSVKFFVIDVCKNTDFWDRDLTEVAGFVESVSEYLYGILNNTAEVEVSKIVKG